MSVGYGNNNGIIGHDHSAKPCPICGAPPRIHVHVFHFNNGHGKTLNIRKSYYDCGGCGRLITDWHEDPAREDSFGRITYGKIYAARDAWDRREFLNGHDESSD